MNRPCALALLVVCAVAIGACEQRKSAPIAPAQIFDAVQAIPPLTDVALPLPLQSVADLRSRSIVTRSGVRELVGAVEVRYSGDAALYDEAATATTEMHTVSAEWRFGSDDSVRVLYTRFSRAIARTLAHEGDCFAAPRPYPKVRITRWANGDGTVWLHWKLADTLPSLNGPIVRPPTLSVGVTTRSRSVQDYFALFSASPCT